MQLGKKTGAFEVVVTNDLGVFTAENLKQFDAICFNNTTGLKYGPEARKAIMGFVKGGNPYGWRTANEGYRGHLVWTKNNDLERANYNWARWYPNLAAGRYEVFVFIPERYTTTSNAHYWVSHAGGYSSRIVNQSANGERWVSLGTYWFDGDSNEFVSLSDVTGEERVSRLIAFDAVKWEPR